ncbi:MAG: ATP-dependent DNA helicase [bacterium]|nr:ATP-dependent DNA helicase [bacterium]
MNQTALKFEDEKIDILAGLNKAQKEAVTHRGGPLLIIAGAGTGKTSVITRRIAYLIEKKIAKPSEILALTFTEKAAAEMEGRVDQLVPYGYTDMSISTFHAFGDQLLRNYAIDLGLPANFKVLTGVEQAIFMRQNIYAFELDHFRPIANPLSHIQALLSHFSRLKDELITPAEYLSFAETKLSTADEEDETTEANKTLELAKAYERYSELMIQAGNLDFGDQLFFTYKVMKENKKILAECQKRYKYILVDEFQDTNYAQNEIVKLLAARDKNVTVVGDDDQSIYRFRGASISNILDFKKTYPSATQIVLNENYRSTQEILDASYKLIQNNNPDRLEIQNKIDKRLSSKRHGTAPELLFCDNLSCEADTVVEKIKELKEQEHYNYNDFVLLVRANSQAEPFLQSLNVAGIPYIFTGASSLFAQPEIKMLVAFLKCLAYTDDSLSLYQLATSEIYNISHDELAEFYTLAKRQNRPLLKVLLRNTSGLDNKFNFTNLSTLISDLDKYSSQKNEPAGEVLYTYLKEKNYLKKLTETSSVEDELKIFNIAKFFDRIAQFNHSSDERGVLAFLNSLELILEIGDEIISSDIDRDIDAVNISTVHAAKGLEYQVVFIVNCVSDRFPGRHRRDPLPLPAELIKERLPEGDFHLQEERRLFYVAATRAKNYLFMTAAEDYGGKRAKKLSQFVLELLDETHPVKLKHKLSNREKIERFQKVVLKHKKLPNKFTADIIRLSRAMIDDYYTCPKKFYFAHIVKIPLLENHYLMYGTAVHAALDYYFSKKLRGETPTLEELVVQFDTAFKNVGFITADHESLRHRQGIETLNRFYADDQKNPTIPTEVETPFEFAENKVKINGRYDLITGVKENSEILDFKTSNVTDQKDADHRIKISTQMMIYALAWYEKYKVIPMTTLVFIESGLTGSRVFNMKELEETRTMIFDVAAGIRKNDMTAQPDSFQCKQCPYNDICPESKA